MCAYLVNWRVPASHPASALMDSSSRPECSLSTFLWLFVRRLLVNLNYTAVMKMLTLKVQTEKQTHGTRAIPHGALCQEESSWAAMEKPSPGSQPALNPASASVVFQFSLFEG